MDSPLIKYCLYWRVAMWTRSNSTDPLGVGGLEDGGWPYGKESIRSTDSGAIIGNNLDEKHVRGESVN